jgi:hypothetical protein
VRVVLVVVGVLLLLAGAVWLVVSISDNSSGGAAVGVGVFLLGFVLVLGGLHDRREQDPCHGEGPCGTP